MKIGVLALQGDYEAHALAMRDVGVEIEFVRRASQMENLQGLILPGGESTAMLNLLCEEGLFQPILGFAERHPILGTCAGAILMAKQVHPPQASLGLMDICVERNAYGRQLQSSIRLLEPTDEFERRGGQSPLEAVLIRAPIIRQTGEGVTVLLKDGEIPVLVEQGRHLASTFHPELCTDRRVQRLFIHNARNPQSTT